MPTIIQLDILNKTIAQENASERYQAILAEPIADKSYDELCDYERRLQAAWDEMEMNNGKH